jgi:biopolymer transport protein ExbD
MRRFIATSSSTVPKINVAPIIDVALVLLIILLITAPMLSVTDMGVSLPQAQTRGIEDEIRLSITLSKTGEMAINEEAIAPDDLTSVLCSRFSKQNNENMLVVVRADEDVSYQAVRKVLRAARAAGAKRLAIATRQSGREKR